MSIEEEIAQTIASEVRRSARVEDWAAALMPLVKRAQAEAWDQAVESASLEETLHRMYIYHPDNPYAESEVPDV